MSASDEKMIKEVSRVLDNLKLASTADVARKINTSRQTASKYLKKAEEKGFAALVYSRKDTKIYSPKVIEKNSEDTPIEIKSEINKNFKKFEIRD